MQDIQACSVIQGVVLDHQDTAFLTIFVSLSPGIKITEYVSEITDYVSKMSGSEIRKKKENDE